MLTGLTPDELALFGDAPHPGNPPSPRVVRAAGGGGRESMIAGDAYEGASRVSVELASYSPPVRSPDQDIRPAKRMADARARDLGRNDANIQGGIRLRQDGIVGAYYMLNARPNSKRLFGKEDVKWEDEFSEELEELFAAYAESEDHWIDAGGRHTLTALTRLAVEQHTVSGETLATVEWKRGLERPFNTAIQMVDIDRLSTPGDKYDDRNLSMGVRLNTWGEPLGYYIREAHPSETYPSQPILNWKYSPARLYWGRKQVLHIYDQHRPGQTRGIGTMVAAISEMKLARQFREIVLQNAILNATYAATIESDSLDPRAIFATLGGTDFPPEEVQRAMENIMAGYYGALDNIMGGSNNLKMGGIKIPFLPPGTKLNLQGAGQGGPLGSEFEASLNRIIASALGVSYEQFTRDYTRTNYSSGKMASVETFKAMLAVKRHIADSFATNVFRLWFEEAWNKGAFTTVRRNMPSFYEGQNREWYCACDWIGASRGQVDELKETQAAVLRVNNNLSTLQEESARLGKDWKKQLRQKKREQDWKEFYGLNADETDTTNQMNAASGTKKPATTETKSEAPSPGTAENLFFDDAHQEDSENE